jgi:hypothetical protein
VDQFGLEPAAPIRSSRDDRLPEIRPARDIAEEGRGKRPARDIAGERAA